MGDLSRAWRTIPYHARAKQYLKQGFGGVLTFGIKGGSKSRKRFIN